MKHARHTLIAAVLLLNVTSGTHAQTTAAAKESVKASCTHLNARSKAECEKVATKMEQSAAAGETPTNSQTKQDPGYVNHSSPVMETKEEKAADKALEDNEDPAAAVAKVKAKDAEVAAAKDKSKKVDTPQRDQHDRGNQ